MRWSHLFWNIFLPSPGLANYTWRGRDSSETARIVWLHVSWDCSYWRDGRDFNDNPRPDFTFSFDTAFFLVKQYLRKFSFDGSLLSLWSEIVKMVMSWASTINYSWLAKARNATFLDGSTEHLGCQQNLVFICRKRTTSLTCSGL